MNFVTGVLISINCNNNIYKLILVIIIKFTKIVDYKLGKSTINDAKLIKAISDNVI